MSAPGTEQIAQAVAARRSWAVQTLSGWVRLGSVLGAEAGAQEYIAGVLDSLGRGGERAAGGPGAHPRAARLQPG